MYEKVNPEHPDKIADRIAGAIVDLAYSKQDDPRIAVEVLLGHGRCFVITEASVEITQEEVDRITQRIAKINNTTLIANAQDEHLAENQSEKIRCGDNGVFKGVPITKEQIELTQIARKIYNNYRSDGKYIIDNGRLTLCQSNAPTDEMKTIYPRATINPLGDWTGGPNVDAGATNRKLGSDMGDSVTGGGLHGKDFSKADVSINIYCWLKAQQTGNVVETSCSIGDDTVDGKPYSEIVAIAKKYINDVGGFEKFAEWGLIR